MGLFGKLLRLTVDTVTLPIDAAKDVVTLGGTCTDEESAVAEKLRRLRAELDDIAEDED